MEFAPHQSFFVIFPRGDTPNPVAPSGSANFTVTTPARTLDGPWKVSFDPKWGGPEEIVFDRLQDWTRHEERGIKYYSGSATYRKSFDFPALNTEHRTLNTAFPLHLDLGTVHDICRVRLNGKDLGILWTAPWRVDITDSLKPAGNQLEVEIVNRWVNRLTGDREAPDKDARTLKWESGLLSGREYKAGRYTFTTKSGPKQLLPSGLIGPVRIVVSANRAE